MRGRFGVLAFAGSFLLLAGCARMGLNPLPEHSESGGMDHGLDAFPEAVHPDEDSNTGLDPFPSAMNPGESNSIGLDAFPEPSGEGKDGKIGLDPFPKMAKGKGFPGLGLNPFPVDRSRREKSAASKVAATSSKTVSTDTPASEDYPGEPPVVLPDAPERGEDVGTPKSTKRRKSYKDD